MKTYLVTGAYGAIGSMMVAELSKDPENHVVRFGRDQLGSVAAAVEGLAASESGPIDTVFHFASDANVRRSFDRPMLTLSNNIGCTVTLLEALRETGQKPLFLLASTPEVYGAVAAPMTGFLETDPIAPANPYAASKAAQEAIVHAYAKSYDFPFVITRAGSYVNPKRADLALSAFARQIATAERKGGHFTLRHGNLNTVRPWCDARDIVQAYRLAASKGHSQQTYNVGALPSRAVRLGEVLEMLLAKAQVPVDLKLDPTLLRPTDITYQALNVGKFWTQTGWAAKTTLAESLDWLMDEARSEARKAHR